MPTAPLLQWVLEHSAHWTLIELSWGRSLAAPIFDFAATFESGGQRFEGRGSSFDQEDALIKACAEALERWAMKEGGFSSSNGLALHSCAAAAEANARRELWERDAFLSRHLSGCQNWRADPAVVSDRLRSVLAWLAANGVECLYSQWEASGLHGAACGAWGETARRPFGVVVGLGTGFSSVEALEKAALEAARNAAAALDGGFDTILDLARFQGRGSYGPRCHRALALDPDYARRLREESAAEPLPSPLDPWSLRAESRPLEGTPFFLARAQDPAAQDLFWGPTTPDKIHPRLKRSGRALSRLPHPVA